MEAEGVGSVEVRCGDGVSLWPVEGTLTLTSPFFAAKHNFEQRKAASGKVSCPSFLSSYTIRMPVEYYVNLVEFDEGLVRFMLKAIYTQSVPEELTTFSEKRLVCFLLAVPLEMWSHDNR